MKTITQILEGKNSVGILQTEISRYIKAMSPKLPKTIKLLCDLLEKYPKINTKEMILDIKSGKFNIFTKLGIAQEDLQEIQNLIKKADKDIKLLPHFLTAHQRQALELNKMNTDDITMDLESEEGRDAVAKQFVPLVYKIVNQFLNKSSLNKAELISAGLMGLTKAMNTYNKPTQETIDGNIKYTTFKQYAAYMIRYQILDDINNYSRAVSISAYYQKKEEETGENTTFLSLDQKYNSDSSDGDDNKFNQDHFNAIADELNVTNSLDNEETNKLWKSFYSKIEQLFPKRDCDIFYKISGINGYNRVKGKDLAKELHVSPAAITLIYKKMIKKIAEIPELINILKSVQQMYTESVMVGLYKLNKQMIEEKLKRDDVFLIFESVGELLNYDKLTFELAVNNATGEFAVEDVKKIYQMIQTTEPHISDIVKNKEIIIDFLNNFYPTENYNNHTHRELLDEIKRLYNYYNKI